MRVYSLSDFLRIMRLVFLILISTLCATVLVFSQNDGGRSINKKGQDVNKENKVQKASPRIPSVEELLKKSKEGKVDADSMWLIIEHAKRSGLTAIDLQSDGSCWVLEKKVISGVNASPYVVKYISKFPNQIGENLLSLGREKKILFADNSNFARSSINEEKLRIGVSSNNGRSVHTSPLISFSQYPDSFREAVTLVLELSRTMPVNKEAMGILSAEFVNPSQVRRLTVLQGQKLIAVKDPGKDAKTLSAIIAAARMPGRKVVVSDPEEWLRVVTYLNYNKRGPNVIEGRFLISVGKQTYRVYAEKTAEVR